MKARILGLALASVVLCTAAMMVAAPATAITTHVPLEEPTIQAAIDFAVSGDLVLVAPGIYTGAANTELDFAGKRITVRSEAGPETTVLDGQGRYHGFRFRSGETRDAVLSGFTIRDCVEWQPGNGALECSMASPTIRNCVIVAHQGTALRLSGGAPLLVGCVLRSNDYPLVSSGSPVISDCTFEANQEAAILSGSTTVLGSTFRDNGSSSAESGAIFAPFFKLAIVDCVFTGNRSISGAAVRTGPQCTLALEKCLFDDNAAAMGGAVYIEGDASIRDCAFIRNRADKGGALFADASSLIEIGSSTFHRNVADDGACVWATAIGRIDVVETIMVFSSRGAAFSCLMEPGRLSFRCCDLFGNAAGDWVGCIADERAINGNFSRDPLFCDAEAGDLTLERSSPCAFGQSVCGVVGARPVACGTLPVAAPWEERKRRLRRSDLALAGHE